MKMSDKENKNIDLDDIKKLGKTLASGILILVCSAAVVKISRVMINDLRDMGI